MRLLSSLIITLLLTGCSVLRTTPQPPPPVTPEAQEISRAQSMNLPRIGSGTVIVRGSPDDAERALAAKANARGASYYLIQLVDETRIPGMWYASAIFYGADSAERQQAQQQ